MANEHTDSENLDRIASALERIANTLEAVTDLQEKVATMNQVRAKPIPVPPGTERGWRRLVELGDATVWEWSDGQAYLDGDGGLVIAYDGAEPRVMALKVGEGLTSEGD